MSDKSGTADPAELDRFAREADALVGSRRQLCGRCIG